jgi:hypothetical protein
MSATTRPINLFPLSLETGAADLCAADFAEIRNVPRTFPKDAAERDCYRYLLGEMQATPDRPHGTKTEIENYCRERFRVTVDSFQYCWREAITVTGARWDQPGRPPGRNLLVNPPR